MSELQSRYVAIRRVLLITFFLNWVVAFSKIVYGLITKSISMTADGCHSLSDGTSNIVGLIGIWVASQPKDKGHPYGHKKYETFASICIAAILFSISFTLLKEVVSRFRRPVMPEVGMFSFLVMAVTLIMNFFVMRYEYKKANQF